MSSSERLVRPDGERLLRLDGERLVRMDGECLARLNGERLVRLEGENFDGGLPDAGACEVRSEPLDGKRFQRLDRERPDLLADDAPRSWEASEPRSTKPLPKSARS